jgi:dipeptidyl aminopeptidase/acylaminoacyl peptidase
MPHRRPWSAVILALFLSGAGASADQDRPAPIDRVVDALSAVHRFGEVALSPDGRTVAWVEALPPREKAPQQHTISLLDLSSPDAAPRRVTGGDGRAAHDEHGLAWSPDGRRVAFLSDAAKEGQLQVYVAPAGGGPVRKLTDVKGFLADLRWSLDGSRLAVLFTEGEGRPTGPVQAAAPEVGVIEEHFALQRLTLLDPETGRARPVSPADLYVYEYDWSPDGKEVVLIGAPGPGDNNWYLAQLATLAVDSGELKALLKPAMQIAVPRWSPDGKTIAFIGGLMSDEGANGGDVYTIPAAGGPARNLTPDLKASASWLTWQPGTGAILFTEIVDGGTGVATLDPATGAVTTLWTGEETASDGGLGLALSHDHKTSAVIRQSFRQPPEVWVGPVGEWKQVTHLNRGERPDWGEARSLHWRSGEWTVQGWLLYPRDYDPKRRYPLVVSVHGGPASARRPTWPGTGFDLGALAAEGYFVFFPNPRGSFGQGERFARANVKDLGHGDLADILAGVDEVLKVAPVDPGRLGIAGWSYGGYMTMWAVTQTGRFRAAVAGAGIANWQSYYGQNGIDQWLIPYFGASVYDDPAVYARSSPVDFIKRVKTPTLVLVGERDEECPPPQSREFWHALKTLGVPTQLVIYAEEGHGIREPSHRRDILRRTAAWLGRYLEEGAPPEGRPGARGR